MRYVGGGIGHGADPLEENDNATGAEITHETTSYEMSDETAVGGDTLEEGDEDDDEDDDGEDQSSEDSGDERASEEDSDSDGPVESSYLDVEDTGFADL